MHLNLQHQRLYNISCTQVNGGVVCSAVLQQLRSQGQWFYSNVSLAVVASWGKMIPGDYFEEFRKMSKLKAKFN